MSEYKQNRRGYDPEAADDYIVRLRSEYERVSALCIKYQARIKELEERNSELSESVNPGPEPERAPGKGAAKYRVTGVAFYISLILIVFVVLSIFSDDHGAPRSLAGFAMMHVLTSSMQSEIPKDSLVVTREVDADSLEIGDDITFLKDSSTTITHRIVGIYENYANTGARGFQTQGVMNSSPDKEIVPAHNLVGKVILHNLIIGKAMLFIKEYALLVVIFTALLIGLFFCLRIVFSKDKVMTGGKENEKYV